MPRGIPRTSTVVDPDKTAVWDRYQFPSMEISGSSLQAFGAQWFAAKATLRKPYCWTPLKPFSFGGKQFVFGYKCVAFASKNHGSIIQKLPDRLIWGRE